MRQERFAFSAYRERYSWNENARRTVAVYRSVIQKQVANYK
jgi:hypothetical protein